MGWVTYPSRISFNTRPEFPTVGSWLYLYVAKDENTIYRWDTDIDDYVSLWWDEADTLQSVMDRWNTTDVDLISTAKIIGEMGKVQTTPPSAQKWDLWFDTWDTHLWERKKTSPAMTSNVLVVADEDISADSWVVWTASSPTNGFITVTVVDWEITFTSSASETCYFTYYILSIFALVKQKKSVAMSWTTLSIADVDIIDTTWIVWTASSVPNWFIEVTVSTWNITFTSTLPETCSFTYYVIN